MVIIEDFLSVGSLKSALLFAYLYIYIGPGDWCIETRIIIFLNIVLYTLRWNWCFLLSSIVFIWYLLRTGRPDATTSSKERCGRFWVYRRRLVLQFLLLLLTLITVHNFFAHCILCSSTLHDISYMHTYACAHVYAHVHTHMHKNIDTNAHIHSIIQVNAGCSSAFVYDQICTCCVCGCMCFHVCTYVYNMNINHPALFVNFMSLSYFVSKGSQMKLIILSSLFMVSEIHAMLDSGTLLRVVNAFFFLLWPTCQRNRETETKRDYKKKIHFCMDFVLIPLMLIFTSVR